MQLDIEKVVTYIIIVAGFIISHWKFRVDLERRLVEVVKDNQNLKKDLSRMEDIIENNSQVMREFEKETRGLFKLLDEKLATLVTEQSTNAIFLRENLKYLTAIVEKHEIFIEHYKKT